MISHYFGIFEAMYHWEENDSGATKKNCSVIVLICILNIHLETYV